MHAPKNVQRTLRRDWLAEGEGFEPSQACRLGDFQDHWHKPLAQPSAIGEYAARTWCTVMTVTLNLRRQHPDHFVAAAALRLWVSIGLALER